jgi:hypothetical protein
MKLVGLVFLGLVASVVIYFPIAILLSMLVSIVFRDPGEAVVMLLAVLGIIPVSLLLGSTITGYFSYYEIENKWELLWMSPVLYCSLIWAFVAGVVFLLDLYAGVDKSNNTGFLSGLWVLVLMALYWYLASLAGVRLGYFLRGRIVRWWYGD